MFDDKTPRSLLVPRALGARPLLLLVDDALDELQDLRRARRLGLAVGEGLAPVGDLAVLGQLVEERARDLDAHAGVGADVLADLRPRQLDAVLLRVAAGAQVEADDQLQGLEGGHLFEQPLDGSFDEVAGVRLGGQILCLWRSFLPMTMRWISLVPSPMSSSGASR